MICVTFYYKEGYCAGFSFEGHADFSSYGSDIVCAGVSSAVQMCCNGILEVLKEDGELKCGDGSLSLKTNSKDKTVQAFLQALRLQIEILREDYNKNIYIEIEEV